MKQKILDLAKITPLMTAREIAASAGCSVQYVSQILKSENLPTQRLHWRNAKETHPLLDFNITNLTVGAISEYTVGVDLMQHGFSVFKSMSAQAACDLICFRGDSKIYKIEVRSAKITAKGNLQYSAPPADRYDCLALCLPGGRVIYKPEIF